MASATPRRLLSRSIHSGPIGSSSDEPIGPPPLESRDVPASLSQATSALAWPRGRGRAAAGGGAAGSVTGAIIVLCLMCIRIRAVENVSWRSLWAGRGPSVGPARRVGGVVAPRRAHIKCTAKNLGLVLRPDGRSARPGRMTQARRRRQEGRGLEVRRGGGTVRPAATG